ARKNLWPVCTAREPWPSGFFSPPPFPRPWPSPAHRAASRWLLPPPRPASVPLWVAASVDALGAHRPATPVPRSRQSSLSCAQPPLDYFLATVQPQLFIDR